MNGQMEILAGTECRFFFSPFLFLFLPFHYSVFRALIEGGSRSYVAGSREEINLQ